LQSIPGASSRVASRADEIMFAEISPNAAADGEDLPEISPNDGADAPDRPV
jgi:hypothetical protein